MYSFCVVTVNCTYDSWQPWSPSICCGGESRSRIRTKSTVESASGTCLGSATQTEICNQDCEEGIFITCFN